MFRKPDSKEPTAESLVGDYFEMEKERRELAKKEADEARPALLAEVDKRNAEARDAAKKSLPNVYVVTHPTGDFLCYGTHDVPLRFIESITVGDAGSPFHLSNAFSINMHSEHIRGGTASISITMHSGQRHSIDCTFADVDAVYHALKSAWKSGEPKREGGAE